jgi:FKBP-type peptidyl-prolyl cis-trans isomerase SlyD
MQDAQGVQIAAPTAMTYLHGGHGQMFDALEKALEGKTQGESLRVRLEPEQAFGDYDAELLRVEPLQRYGEGVAVGMEIEEDEQVYTVTDVADGKVVLDANHALAGIALRFLVEIISIRKAEPEEIERGVSLPQE